MNIFVSVVNCQTMTMKLNYNESWLGNDIIRCLSGKYDKPREKSKLFVSLAKMG